MACTGFWPCVIFLAERGARIAPLVTAIVAAVAGTIAIVAIFVQRSVARKRAAIDFFLKTEMDDKMWEAYRNSRKGFGALKAGIPIEVFLSSEDYVPVRRYLNVHELMAVGVHQGVLDGDVCYSFWADELMGDYTDARSLIEYIRGAPSEGTRYTYADLEELSATWRARAERAV